MKSQTHLTSPFPPQHTSQNNASLFFSSRPRAHNAPFLKQYLSFFSFAFGDLELQTDHDMYTTASMLVFLFISFHAPLFQLSCSTTVVVDGVSWWKNPTVHVGDSVIFRHKNHYGLYIFQNREAFNLCNFTQSTLLTQPNSTSYTWHPSRIGFFFFSFNNGSLKACQQAQKLAIKVEASTVKPWEKRAASPNPPPRVAHAPTSGDAPTASPDYPWPFRPHEAVPPSASPPAAAAPHQGSGIQFINSNPAVPLPTGEVDSATIRPVPTSGHGGLLQVGVGLFAAQVTVSVVCVVLVMI